MVKLLNNVEATPIDTNGDSINDSTSFGTGAGFGGGSATGNGCILVPLGKFITLDLNSHTVDRAVGATAIDGGQVIKVLNDLILMDSVTGGTITGGNTAGNDGGGVRVVGLLNMNGGTIGGSEPADANSASLGGGVCLTSVRANNILKYGIVNLTGGTIRGNRATTDGGGVYINNNGLLKMFKNPDSGSNGTLTIDTQKVTKPTADSTAFIADGTSKTYAIAADSRYTISGNVKSAFGLYTVTVALNDTANYEWVGGTTANLAYDFVIRQPQVTDKTEDAVEMAEVIVTAENGFSPNITISITVVEQTEEIKVNSYIANDEEITNVYDVKMLLSGAAIQPEGYITIRILLPKECDEGKVFRLLHVHGENIIEMPYTIDGNYVVVTTDKLSDFVFVANKDVKSLLWLIILLIIIILIEIGLAVYKLRKDKAAKDKVKTYSFMPLLLAYIIPAGQIGAVIALGIVAVLGGIYDVYLYLKKDKLNNEDEGNPSAEE